MNERTFYVVLITITAVMTMVLYFILQMPLLADHAAILYTSVGFFILLSVVLYYVSKKAAVHKNPMLFFYVMVVGIMSKFGFCILALFIYNRLVQPENKFFVLPFLGIYLIYTIFETYFMYKLGKLKRNDQITG